MRPGHGFVRLPLNERAANAKKGPAAAAISDFPPAACGQRKPVPAEPAFLRLAAKPSPADVAPSSLGPGGKERSTCSPSSRLHLPRTPSVSSPFLCQASHLYSCDAHKHQLHDLGRGQMLSLGPSPHDWEPGRRGKEQGRALQLWPSRIFPEKGKLIVCVESTVHVAE